MKFITVETHTHTVHSDASLTVAELLNASRKAELEAIVLTDHNTDSGLDEIAAGQTNPVVVSGIEWTTFYGHVIVIAPNRFVEWRDLTKSNLDAHLEAVHEADGIAVLAHPCDPGEPFCCGCHCDFAIQNWGNLDAMEVWHEGDPDGSVWNARAKALWLKKLNEGFRTTALCASDWHETFAPDIPFGVNYLEIDESLPITAAIKDAIRGGRCFLSTGPTVQINLTCSGRNAGIGGTLPPGRATVSLQFDDTQRRRVWEQYRVEPESVALIGNDREDIAEFPGYGTTLSKELTLRPGYFRLELRGSIHAKQRTILMTNPVYVQ